MGREWVCNQTKGFKAPVFIAPDISVFASKWIDNLKVNQRHHWKLLNHYCEINFSYINDINLVWRGCVTINIYMYNDRRKKIIAKKCLYSGLEVWRLIHILTFYGNQYYFLKKTQQHTDMAFLSKLWV